MSPILNIQRRLAEVGRIRIGDSVEATSQKTGKKFNRPVKLQTFRLTSANARALARLAEVYGGAVHPWEDAPVGNQFEVITKADELSVIVPPESMSFTQHYETWAGGTCVMRCDGQWDTVRDCACSCDPEDRTCKPHTRLSVMIAEVATSGMWRLDTQGYYAASELGGAFDLAQLMSQATNRTVLRASLRLDQREVKRPDEPTRQFVVPVLAFDLEAAALPAATGGLTPIDAPTSGGVLGAIAAVESAPPRPTRANAAEPVPPTGRRPSGAPAPDDDGPVVMASADQMGQIVAGIDMATEAEKTAIKEWWQAQGWSLIPRDLTSAQASSVLAKVTEVLDAGEASAGDVPAGATIPAQDLPVPKPTPAKMRQMFALLSEEGTTGDEAQHDRVWAIMGRAGASFTELTRDEVNRVIDQLKLDKEAKVLAAHVSNDDPKTPEGDYYDAEGF